MRDSEQALPAWADHELSQSLPTLAARGEGQDREFMVKFPDQVRELAKEIAAFATSNAGMVLLGVSDAGDIIGLDDAATVKARDQLLLRLGGVCTNAVRPAVTPTAAFAMHEGRTVLVVTVPKGSEPVYYAHHIPYVRHLTESRPAEPHEVLGRVREHLGVAPPPEENEAAHERFRFYSDLASILVTVLMYADEIEERQVSPWLEILRAEFAQAANELRELAVRDIAMSEDLSAQLDELAAALSGVASLRLHLGSGPEIGTLVQGVVTKAEALKAERIDTGKLDERSLGSVRDQIVMASRKLHGIVRRSESMINNGQTEEFQNEAADIGRQLLRLSYYNIDSIASELSSELRTIGRTLHLIETMQIYMDGGRSIRAIEDRVTQAEESLSSLVDRIESRPSSA